MSGRGYSARIVAMLAVAVSAAAVSAAGGGWRRAVAQAAAAAAIRGLVYSCSSLRC